MKILIVYSKEGGLSQYAEALKQGAETKGHQVTLKVADEKGDNFTARMFDYVIVGSPIKGLLGGKMASDMSPYLNSIKGLEGKESLAFTVWKPLGTDKSLRKLMNLMESQGCIVKDFQAFHSLGEAKALGKEL